MCMVKIVLFLIGISIVFLAGVFIGADTVKCMSPVESCESLLKVTAGGTFDPGTGLLFVKTRGIPAETVEHIILHELGHYYLGPSEELAEEFAFSHTICRRN